MKRTIVLMTAVSLISAVPAFATVHGSSHAGMDDQCAKDCAMLVKDCAQQTDSIQQRISRLQTELGKGTAVYTTAELQRLQGKLKEAKATLRILEENK